MCHKQEQRERPKTTRQNMDLRSEVGRRVGRLVVFLLLLLFFLLAGGGADGVDFLLRFKVRVSIDVIGGGASALTVTKTAIVIVK